MTPGLQAWLRIFWFNPGLGLGCHEIHHDASICGCSLAVMLGSNAKNSVRRPWERKSFLNPSPANCHRKLCLNPLSIVGMSIVLVRGCAESCIFKIPPTRDLSPSIPSTVGCITARPRHFYRRIHPRPTLSRCATMSRVFSHSPGNAISNFGL